MTPTEALLESWDRQCRCLSNLIGLITPDLLTVPSSPDGWTIAFHLCHIDAVRADWLRQASGSGYQDFQTLFNQVDGEWQSCGDLVAIRAQLDRSQTAISAWMRMALDSNLQKAGPYDHPVFFLQHMIWHEGYHFGLLNLALRRAGREPDEVWEERQIWSNWRECELD